MKLSVRPARPVRDTPTRAGKRAHLAFRAGVLALAAAVTLVSAPAGTAALAEVRMVQPPEDGDIAGTVPLFDVTRGHTFSLSFADADYQSMLDIYWATQEKEWVKADIVIDGTAIPEVGIRLKGNSTLMSLTRNGQPVPGGFGGGFGRTPLRTEEPETLPWLVKFDKFVDDRTYQGYKAIAVRASGAGTGVTVNEAVALTLLKQAGDPYQKFSYSTVTVNDRPAKLRLLLEDPGAKFSNEIGPNGVLYKSQNTHRFTYKGTDLAAYEDDFKQITKEKTETLQPMVDLIKWVTESTDEQFQAEFENYVDLPSFARYAAYQNLTLNWDDMAGPGHNYYVWYDLDNRKSTILTTDLNLSFSSRATTGPCDQVGIGGFGGGPVSDPLALSLLAQEKDPADAAPGAQPPGGFSMGHPLKERFLALPAFRQAYAEAYRTLYKAFFTDGAAAEAVDQMVSVLATIPTANQATVQTEASTLRNTIQSRTTSLAGHAVIQGGTCG